VHQVALVKINVGKRRVGSEARVHTDFAASGAFWRLIFCTLSELPVRSSGRTGFSRQSFSPADWTDPT
jgi:hypothetical protein